MRNNNLSFSTIKIEFDNKYENISEYESPVPMHLTCNKKVKIKNTFGGKNEEYYRCQFIYSLINSGMYSKDYIPYKV